MAKNKDRKLFGRGKWSGWMRGEDEPREDNAEEFEERRPVWAADIANSRKTRDEDRDGEPEDDRPRQFWQPEDAEKDAPKDGEREAKGPGGSL